MAGAHSTDRRSNRSYGDVAGTIRIRTGVAMTDDGRGDWIAIQRVVKLVELMLRQNSGVGALETAVIAIGHAAMVRGQMRRSISPGASTGA